MTTESQAAAQPRVEAPSPEQLTPPAAVQEPRRRAEQHERRAGLWGALGPYLATRGGLLLLVFAGTWTVRQTVLTSPSEYLLRWERWDALILSLIAQHGYDGDPAKPPDIGLPSFFPGFPMVLRAVHVLVPSWALAGLLVSLVAGAFAAVALHRLALLEGLDRTAASRAVLYLFAAPYAYFLVAGYSEALFLALALPAWLAAREGRWVTAGLLAGGASYVRVSGLFLGAGLVVMYALAVRRPRWDALALLAPFAAVFSYFAYLYSRTGDWLAWTHAQERAFNRRFSWPWDAFQVTLEQGLNPGQGAEYRLAFFAEIAAVALGVLLVVVLLVKRRWPEATYVGLSLAALSTSTFFFSVTRASLLWFPLYLLIAAAAARRSWVHGAYLAVSLPLLGALALTYTSGFWTA